MRSSMNLVDMAGLQSLSRQRKLNMQLAAYILRDALENINQPLDDCNESCCCNSSCAQLLEQLTPITTACPVTKIHTNSTNWNEVVGTVTIFFLPNPPVILIPLWSTRWSLISLLEIRSSNEITTSAALTVIKILLADQMTQTGLSLY
jgi:hypothetical protein